LSSFLSYSKLKKQTLYKFVNSDRRVKIALNTRSSTAPIKQMSNNLHLLIVTEQTQANLIPVLQLKPDKIALAISTQMQPKADAFIKLLKQVGGYLDEQIICFKNIPNVGLNDIEEKAIEIVLELEETYPDYTLTYHATGGTKLMTLGFYDAFKEEGKRIIYTDTRNGQIEIVYPKKHAPIAIESVLTIDSYLQSLDKQLRKSASEEWRTQAQQRKTLTKWLGINAKNLERFFGVINYMISNALKNTRRNEAPEIENPQQQFNQSPSSWGKQALEKFIAAGLCQWDATSPSDIYFHNIDAAG